ncbi:MAG: lysophospholipid acyltransferase family protein [candidate division Zixibacteria bacterium]|nr:lysophospholipid acyltransferase family protein [candidate division Zixibacteria bacterium]
MAGIGHHVEYLAAQIGMGLVRTLTARQADSLGASLGSMACRLLGSRRQLACDNIKQALTGKLADSEIDDIVRRVFQNIGRTLVELARFEKLGAERIRDQITPAGLETIEKALERGNGAILGTAHFGNWEIMGVYPAVYGIPSDTLAIQQHNLRINRLVINLRQSLGVKILEVPANARQVFRALDNNRVVIIAADQHAAAGTLVMDFFGRPAAIARGPALFAMRRNCPLIPMLMRRERYDRHLVIAGDAIYPPKSGDEENDLRSITATYLRFLEKHISTYPDQWLWTHNRWKIKNVDGNPESGSS